MIYEEVTSGGVLATGCGKIGRLWSSVSRFAIGESVFNVAKAHRGRLERIVIKDVRLSVSRRTRGRQTFIYQDTFNGLWNEYDLVPYEVAVELIQRHLDAIEADRQKLKLC